MSTPTQYSHQYLSEHNIRIKVRKSVRGGDWLKREQKWARKLGLG